MKKIVTKETYWTCCWFLLLCWETDFIFKIQISFTERCNCVFIYTYSMCIYMFVSVCSHTVCVYLERIQSGPALVCVCCLTSNECVARLISRAAGLHRGEGRASVSAEHNLDTSQRTSTCFDKGLSELAQLLMDHFPCAVAASPTHYSSCWRRPKNKSAAMSSIST